MGNNRNIAFWVVLFLLIVVLFNVFSTGSSSMQSREVPFSEFVKNVSGGEIRALISPPLTFLTNSEKGTSRLCMLLLPVLKTLNSTTISKKRTTQNAMFRLFPKDFLQNCQIYFCYCFI